MNPTERKRFLYINFVLADNDTDSVVDAIASLMSVCEDLQESIADEHTEDKVKA
jgi:hypothetical protein